MYSSPQCLAGCQISWRKEGLSMPNDEPKKIVQSKLQLGK